MKCLYCARPLRRGGLWCHACRRYVLRWPHIMMLALMGIAILYVLLEFAG